MEPLVAVKRVLLGSKVHPAAPHRENSLYPERSVAHRPPELARRARRYGRFTEYCALGQAGRRVSVLAMGTMTFGRTGPFANVGTTLAAASLTHTEAERAELDKVSAAPLIYPYWRQARTARDWLSPGDLTLLGPYPA